MRPMASNGMSPSFYPPPFMLHMQTPQEVAEEHQHQHHHHQQQQLLAPVLNPFLPSPQCNSLPDFRGMAAAAGKRGATASSGGGGEEGGMGEDELSDDGSALGEKKRRLNVEQVRTLEKNFELGNKLEPERKMQLARLLNLQPRQVAIWFQNRRARWKTKQLEKDYDLLKRQFDALRSENDALHSHNKKLQAEILALKGSEASELINLNKETEASCSNRSENSSEINLDASRTPAIESPAAAGNPSSSQLHLFHPSIRAAAAGAVDIDHFIAAGRAHGHEMPPQVVCPKIELAAGGMPAPDHGAHHAGGAFGNLLCAAVDEQPPFWPWADQHHFH